jgi:hypothetical protein
MRYAYAFYLASSLRRHSHLFLRATLPMLLVAAHGYRGNTAQNWRAKMRWWQRRKLNYRDFEKGRLISAPYAGALSAKGCFTFCTVEGLTPHSAAALRMLMPAWRARAWLQPPALPFRHCFRYDLRQSVAWEDRCPGQEPTAAGLGPKGEGRS